MRKLAVRPRGSRQGEWGAELDSLRNIQPGDILQFENVLFLSRRLQDDGTPFLRTRTLGHHTAIVTRVKNAV